MEINGSNYTAVPHDIDRLKLAAAKTRAINNAIDIVKGAIRSLTDEDRKRVLELALRELSSTLGVHKSGGLFRSLLRR